MDNLNDIIAETIADGNESLPLRSFFATLKENGFTVTPLQVIHAHKIIIQYANWVKNENELCMYLAPVFVTSEDEQELFKKLFTRHFKTVHTGRVLTKPAAVSIENKLKQHWKKFLILYVVIALLVILFIIKAALHEKHFDPAKIEVLVSDKNDPAAILGDTIAFQTAVNNKLEIITTCRYNKRVTDLETKVSYEWGDSSYAGSLPSHIYSRPGQYNFTAYIDVLYKNTSLKKDTVHRIVNVCSSGNSLTVLVSPNIDSLIVSKKIRLVPVVSGPKKPIKISWQLDNTEFNFAEKKEFLFTKAGFHTVTCTAYYDSIVSPCNIQKHIELKVHDTGFKKPTITPVDAATDPQEEATVTEQYDYRSLVHLYKVLAAIFLVLSAFFIFLWLKELQKTGRIKTKVLDKYKKLVSSFTSSKAPAILPFKNRNYIPVQESEINDIAKLLRKRVKDSISFMHVKKTINRAIERGGFFEPVKEARTRQSEYLVLIDESNDNSQQVKLFEYLVVMLKKQNVLVEKYYYKKHPGFCYNIHEPKGISLEKLHGKYQRYVLLILGDAYQLIDKNTHEIAASFAAQLNHWQHKAIITPVSFIDWQKTERSILLPHIPIVPADMEGLILLAEMLTEKENAFDIISRLNRQKAVFYSAAAIDFNNVRALEKYCSIPGWARKNENDETVNVLFEWVAALAIYPKLRWEITLAIGKDILEKYGLHRQLNYTILLRIARISWMKQGVIPDQLRLQLLQQLTLESEKTARQTLLVLLKEIPQQEVEGSSDFEEKEVQQVINEFSLYAHDPVLYNSYSESKFIFEKLWHDNLLKDAPATLYLKNEQHQWKTLINQPGDNHKANYNASAEEYLQTKEKEETILSKVYLALGLISIVVLLTSLAALRVLYIWQNFL
ncbi:hypothetical protein [Ferruginibacter sp.]